jgi:hypothetical protein
LAVLFDDGNSRAKRSDRSGIVGLPENRTRGNKEIRAVRSTPRCAVRSDAAIHLNPKIWPSRVADRTRLWQHRIDEFLT